LPCTVTLSESTSNNLGINCTAITRMLRQPTNCYADRISTPHSSSEGLVTASIARSQLRILRNCHPIHPLSYSNHVSCECLGVRSRIPPCVRRREGPYSLPYAISRSERWSPTGEFSQVAGRDMRGSARWIWVHWKTLCDRFSRCALEPADASMRLL